VDFDGFWVDAVVVHVVDDFPGAVGDLGEGVAGDPFAVGDDFVDGGTEAFDAVALGQCLDAFAADP
jgi:hypothetical protein